MADKLRAQQQFEQLQTRFIGVGTPDTTKYEWQSNVHRDSYASYVGHPPLLEHFSIALGQPQELTRVNFIDRMIRPCGPSPEESRESGDYRIKDKQ